MRECCHCEHCRIIQSGYSDVDLRVTLPGFSSCFSPFGITATASTPSGIVTLISKSFLCFSHCTAIFPDGLSNDADAFSIGPGSGAISTLCQPVLPGCCRIPATYA